MLRLREFISAVLLHVRFSYDFSSFLVPQRQFPPFAGPRLITGVFYCLLNFKTFHFRCAPSFTPTFASRAHMKTHFGWCCREERQGGKNSHLSVGAEFHIQREDTNHILWFFGPASLYTVGGHIAFAKPHDEYLMQAACL